MSKASYMSALLQVLTEGNCDSIYKKTYHSYINLTEGKLKGSKEEEAVVAYLQNYLKTYGDMTSIKVPHNTDGKYHAVGALGSPIEPTFAADENIKISVATKAEIKKHNFRGSDVPYEFTVGGIGKAWIKNTNQKQGDDSKSFTIPKASGLGPSDFNLSNVGGHSPKTIKGLVKAKLINMRLPEVYKEFLTALLDKACQSGSTMDLSDLNLEGITEPSLGSIAKDYGEILAALWCCYNKQNGAKYTKIEFPESKQAPLTDFRGLVGKRYYHVSVKSGNGAATTIKPLLKKLLIMKKEHEQDYNKYKFTPLQLELITVLETIAVNSGGAKNAPDRVLKSAANLKTPAMIALEKVSGISTKNISSGTLKNWVAPMKHPTLKNKLKPFYKKCSSTMKAEKDEYFENLKGEKQYGLPACAIARDLTALLNTKYKEALTTLAANINVIQCRIDLDAKKLKFKPALFKDLVFKFECNSMPNKPENGNGMRYKATYK